MGRERRYIWLVNCTCEESHKEVHYSKKCAVRSARRHLEDENLESVEVVIMDLSKTPGPGFSVEVTVTPHNAWGIPRGAPTMKRLGRLKRKRLGLD